VRGEPALGFDRGEVLDVPADEAAQVLHEPVDQPGEVDRVAGGAAVVVPVRVDRRPIRADRPVRAEGRRDEEGRAEPLGVDPAHGPGVDSAARQLGDVLPPPCGADAAGSRAGSDPAADAGVGGQLVELVDDRVDLARVLTGVLGVDPGPFKVGPHGGELALLAGGGLGLEDGFGVEVPALPALGDAEPAGAFGAGRAFGGEGGAAGDVDDLGLAGGEVDAADGDGADADAVVDGGGADDVAGEWHQRPLHAAGSAFGHAASAPVAARASSYACADSSGVMRSRTSWRPK